MGKKDYVAINKKLSPIYRDPQKKYHERREEHELREMCQLQHNLIKRELLKPKRQKTVELTETQQILRDRNKRWSLEPHQLTKRELRKIRLEERR